MPATNGILLTAKQVKDVFGVSLSAVYKMKDRGTLPYVVIEDTNAVRFRNDDVQKAIQEKPTRKKYTRKNQDAGNPPDVHTA